MGKRLSEFVDGFVAPLLAGGDVSIGPPIRPADWRHGQGGNDLETVACARFPAVAEHLARLRQFAPQALMTGSGACVFAGFPTRSEAEAVFSRLPASMTGWLAAGLPEHPLAGL